MATLELEKSVTFKNILAATDFSDASRHALRWAASITGLNDGKLFLLNVLPGEPRLPVTLDPLPVSYTHLDVYKRQTQENWRERRQLSNRPMRVTRNGRASNTRFRLLRKIAPAARFAWMCAPPRTRARRG